MAVYFVSSADGDDTDDGTTMDDGPGSGTGAWATVDHALEAGGLSAGDTVFVRRTHSETPTADISCIYDGNITSPITIMGWPRAAHSIASADFTNGSTSVNVDDNDMDREQHQGRWLTGPDGKDYLITRVVDSATLTIDREYAGSTAANEAVTIKADEDWVDDMGTAYGFDDSGWTIKETAWDADADDLPNIDFNGGAYSINISADIYHVFKNLEFLDSTDGYGIFNINTNRWTTFIGCLFKQTENAKLISSFGTDQSIYIDRCIFEGNSTGTSQVGLRTYSGIIKNSAFYNFGDVGVMLEIGRIYFENVNIGVELANDDADILLATTGILYGKDVKLGGSNGYLDYNSNTIEATCVIHIENYGKVLGIHKTWYTGGTFESAAVTGETPNKKVSDNVLKISPNTDLQYDPDYAVEMFSHEFEATTDSLTYKYWLYNDTGDTLNDGDAKGSIWLEAEYVDSYDDTTEYTQTKVYSSDNTIADAADADDWDSLSVTVQPAVASKVRIVCKCRHYTAAGDIFIDPAVVIS